MATLRITTTVEKTGPAAAIILSDEQVAALGGTKSPPVLVTIDERTVRVRCARMGGKNMIGFRKELRDQLGIEAGDTVEATIELDVAERVVDVPAALAAAMTSTQRAAFDAWSYTRRKEAVRGVSEAKRAETRQRRIMAVLDELG